MSGSNWDPNILIAPAAKAPLPLHLGILFAPPRPVSRGVVGNDVPPYTDATNIDAIFDKQSNRFKQKSGTTALIVKLSF